MLWLSLLLHTGLALADEPSPVPSTEPLFCTDPVVAVCEPTERILPNKAETDKQVAELRKQGPQVMKAAFAKFREMEKQSFIPLLDETRARLIEAVNATSDLSEKDRAKLRAILEHVKFASLSGASDAVDQANSMRTKLPKNSILLKVTPEGLDIIKNKKFDRMTPLELEVLRKLALVKGLARSQDEGCGELVPINAFSLGSGWGIPSVSLCLESMLRLQPLNVQARYPILGMVFGHELGHHIDNDSVPGLFSKYLSCLRDENPGGNKKFSEDWSREIAADFWSAVALGNTLKTRAALLEEPPEAERNRAIHFLRSSLQWLCGTAGGTHVTHPPYDFRIGKIFGQSPEIRKIMGCSPKPVCGLSGRR